MAWTPALHAMHPALDAVETTRAAGYPHAADRRRFVTAAALLRTIVAAELGVEPRDVPVSRRCRWCGGPHGRPALPGGWHASITHTGDLVGVALTHSGPVGLDAEHLHAVDRAVLADLLAPGEPEPGTDADVLRLWSAKESALKATGDGLTRSMATFTATHPATLHDAAQTHVLHPPPGHVAALTVLCHAPLQIVERRLDPAVAA